MKRYLTLLQICILFLVPVVCQAQKFDKRENVFDSDWRFGRDTTLTTVSPEYEDSQCRTVLLPHDWSIEDLPNQSPDTINGPFNRTSVGQSATGFAVGGIGVYRKKFFSDKSISGKKVRIHFDGVYMNAEVWFNGHQIGTRPYGYTAFEFDLTPFLKPLGEENIIVVRVRNTGKNSRWYSGSGIYRHVWLIVTNPMHVPTWGVSITTPKVSIESAVIQIEEKIENERQSADEVVVLTSIISPDGKKVIENRKTVRLGQNTFVVNSNQLVVEKPILWSTNSPKMYIAITEIRSGKKVIDRVETTFGIRSIRFDANRGFLLNDKRLILKGGCIHLDNGPLGAATFDRAEERKIEILKNAGYNAVRISHSPPSKQLLDACDRIGMLVIDEAFDMWETAKNPEDYHLDFKDWWKRDLHAMILRDRNHPSVIMWSIGNEIYEAPETRGHVLAKELATEAKNLDPTRPVTGAIVFLPPYTRKPWADYELHLTALDVDGYNYFIEPSSRFFVRDTATARRFDSEHLKHNEKTFIATEYTPGSALENYRKSEEAPYFIGAFKWTAMDYLGEAGIGRPLLVPDETKVPDGLMRMGFFYKPEWPVFNAYSGDFDLIGNKKAASFYQDVVWGNSIIELLVHQPIPQGMKEIVAPWGFPDELKSWTWPGHEAKEISINVYTSGSTVRLELNGKIISEKNVPEGSITVSFKMEYQPGKLVARAFREGKEIGSSELSTTGKPVAIRLRTDRSNINANPNDLSFVSVEAIDASGNVVPNANDIPISFKLKGNATVAGVGNGDYDDASSFQSSTKKLFQGKALIVVRPSGKPGKVTLEAFADGLQKDVVEIVIK